MEPNKSFFSFDSLTIFAFILIGVTWFLWNDHMKKKYPHFYGERKNVSKEKTQPKKDLKNSFHGGVVENGKNKSGESQWFKKGFEKKSDPSKGILEGKRQKEKFRGGQKEELFAFEDENWSFSFSSRGMGLKNFILKKFKNRDFKPMSLGGNKVYFPFQTQIIGHRQPLHFDILKRAENEYEGKAMVGEVKIVKVVRFDSEKYSFDIKIEIFDEEMKFPGLLTLISDPIRVEEERSFFAPSFAEQEFFVLLGQGKDKISVRDLKNEKTKKEFHRVQMASLNSHYFSIALLNQSNVLPSFRIFQDSMAQEVFGVLRHDTLSSSKKMAVHFIGFMGPKSYELLNQIHSSFFRLIDFGMFGFISKYMLLLMNFFYKVVQNWGVAIILMTILVRLLLLPLNLKSYRSMKSMQTIQPYIKEIRKKFKKDPRKMNQEVMNLMKTHKVNPLGGCLPMLLQFPIFIALYQVLGRSVELYQAPFVFWVKDLSVKDPYYVLPILMGLVMFLQQKITPQPLDSTQAKILMFLPFIFTFFMLTLPSGLALYILVSSLFAVLQQLVFMRGDRPMKKQ